MSFPYESLLDFTQHLVGGNLEIGTADIENRSTSPTEMDADEWTEMFEYFVNIRPRRGISLIYVYVYLKYRVQATTGTADVEERIQVRTRHGRIRGSWLTISDELATPNIGAAWIERITSGVLLPIDGLMYAPFFLKVEMQTNEADTARLEVSSESYVRVVGTSPYE